MSSMAATLCHLDREEALLALPPERPARELYWGARVRFWIGEGTQRCETVGQIVAHDLPHREAWPEDVPPDGEYRLRLRLCSCRPARRRMPRKAVHQDVRYRLAEESGESQTGATGSAPAPLWRGAQCVDIGCGGIRLSVTETLPPSRRLVVQFRLFVEGSAPRLFQLDGRVLRTHAERVRADRAEVAVKFDRMRVEDSLALSHLLSAR